MENDALFYEYSGKQDTQVIRKLALLQISNASRQQILNNDTNRTIKNPLLLTADQTRPVDKTPKRSFPHLNTWVFVAFPTGRDITWSSLEKSPYLHS
ncbi:hypothetical protein AVEN_183771-1 [Araneus ventricosus]|uniref:Uncharacterized protein n=1 Tax=Araneus ventricosus TaxID=182803 RepID=A0A4Y2V2I6_ARAVE|nr:hypothetical protein AVEN_183771-1 [Araneus ventricosus]